MYHLEKINKNVRDGIYYKKNLRNSNNICVSFNGINFNCKVIEEETYNVENELIFTIKQEIDEESNYHFLSIFNVKEGSKIVQYSLNK
jgi:hypothetical protein